MSLPYRQGGGAERPEPLEDTNYKHISTKQINYIEILKNKLNFTIPTRNAHIESIIGNANRRNPVDKRFDIWLLSSYEASLVIGQFKKWLEERDQ